MGDRVRKLVTLYNTETQQESHEMQSNNNNNMSNINDNGFESTTPLTKAPDNRLTRTQSLDIRSSTKEQTRNHFVVFNRLPSCEEEPSGCVEPKNDDNNKEGSKSSPSGSDSDASRYSPYGALSHGDEMGENTEDSCDTPPDPSMRQLRRTKSLYGASPNVKFGPKASIMKTNGVLTIQDPSTQRLTWYKAPLTVLIIKKIHDDTIIPHFVALVHWLVTVKKMVAHVEAKVLEEPCIRRQSDYETLRHQVKSFREEVDDLTDKIDLIITLGGDGTLLYASSLFQESVPPVMAFHFGSLGFLSPFDIYNFKEKITEVLKGNVPLCLRTRLKCMVHRANDRDNTAFKSVESRQHQLVLNEIVVDRGPYGFICNVDLYIEHKHVTSVQGDGIIISTPTGSTAYAAASGASMVHPNVPAIVIAPICAHSLSFRPIIVPAGVEIKIKLNDDARNCAFISFDGRNRTELQKGDSLRISTSIYPVPSLCAADQMHDWFDRLADCLHWNMRRPQKPLRPIASDSSVEGDGCSSALSTTQEESISNHNKNNGELSSVESNNGFDSSLKY